MLKIRLHKCLRLQVPHSQLISQQEHLLQVQTEVGEMIDRVKAMDMTPAISSQQIANSFLNQREPLMRDPRK